MKKITISIVLILLLIPGLSQLSADSQLDFKEIIHDFGSIKEVDGPVSYQFNFTNNSKSEIEINSVKST